MAFLQAASAAGLSYPREVAKWKEVPMPSDKDYGGWMAFYYAADYSKYNWTVFSHGDTVYARQRDEKPEQRKNQPTFTPTVGPFQKASAVEVVEDGWLIGFNQGEWGGALYWFSRDGRQNYKVSDDQVVGFFRLSDGLYAVEGLSHMGLSSGSVIRLTHPRGKNEHWKAVQAARLPFAPYAVSVRRYNSAVLTLSDAIATMGMDHKVHPILSTNPWGDLRPNSSVLSKDGRKLWLGMIQYVAEVDLLRKSVRLLVPSLNLVNRLGEAEADSIRKRYRGRPPLRPAGNWNL